MNLLTRFIDYSRLPLPLLLRRSWPLLFVPLLVPVWFAFVVCARFRLGFRFRDPPPRA